MGDTVVRQAFPGVSKRMRRRPAHAREQVSRNRTGPPQPDKPVSPVRRRTKHRIMRAQCRKCFGDTRCCYAWDIATDYANRAGRRTTQGPSHAITQVTVPLWDTSQMRRPNARQQPCTIRRHNAAATIPISRPSRVLTRPARGSFSITTSVRLTRGAPSSDAAHLRPNTRPHTG